MSPERKPASPSSPLSATNAPRVPLTPLSTTVTPPLSHLARNRLTLRPAASGRLLTAGGVTSGPPGHRSRSVNTRAKTARRIDGRARKIGRRRQIPRLETSDCRAPPRRLFGRVAGPFRPVPIRLGAGSRQGDAQKTRARRGNFDTGRRTSGRASLESGGDVFVSPSVRHRPSSPSAC